MPDFIFYVISIAIWIYSFLCLSKFEKIVWCLILTNLLHFFLFFFLLCFFLCSDFSEIFDVDRFISVLSKDVKIIKQIPRKGGKSLTPYHMRVPRKCNEKCYQNRVLPVLLKRHVSFSSLNLFLFSFICYKFSVFFFIS